MSRVASDPYLDDRIPTIIERVRVVELLAEHGHEPVRRTGSTWHYHCPFPDHPDPDPSFKVKDDRWRCWSACGTGGDVVDLVVALDNVGTAEAIERLAGRIGLERPGRAPWLKTLSSAKARHYLERFVAERGWTMEAAEKARLYVVLDSYGCLRVRFPFVYGDRVVWHQDRLLGRGKPKWLSPDGMKPALYNANALRLAQERRGLWVVEGLPDTLAVLSSFEEPAVVGVPGVNSFRVQWLLAFGAADLSQVFLVADNDDAGMRMRCDVTALLSSTGLRGGDIPVVRSVLQVMVPVEFHDLDDWRRTFAGDAESFLGALLQAVTEAQAEYDRGVRL